MGQPGKGESVVPLGTWAEAVGVSLWVQFGYTGPQGLESCEFVSYKPQSHARVFSRAVIRTTHSFYR